MTHCNEYVQAKLFQKRVDWVTHHDTPQLPQFFFLMFSLYFFYFYLLFSFGGKVARVEGRYGGTKMSGIRARDVKFTKNKFFKIQVV